MKFAILLAVALFVGCEAPEPAPEIEGGCPDGICVAPELVEPTGCPHCTVEPMQAKDNCRFGNCPPDKPEPTPPFSFAPEPDDTPAPAPEIKTPTKEGPNVDVIIALVATVAGMVGSYVASRNDDDPDNDMDIRLLVKDVVAKIQKARA